MPIRKALGKAYKGAKKGLKKRYGLNKRSTGLKYNAIASDIMMLKQMVNAEKKQYAYSQSGALGQVNGNNTGALCVDITPYLSQGVGADARTGASVKLHSALYQFQFTQQTALTIRQRMVIEFYVNKGTQLDTATALTYMYTPSTFSNVIDANSARDNNRFSDFQLIRRVNRTIAPEQLTGDATTSTFDIPIKFNRGKGHHVRLVTNPTGVPQDCLNGQIFMVIRADVGNANALTASTRNVPLTAVNTGSTMRFAYKVWYYDN